MVLTNAGTAGLIISTAGGTVSTGSLGLHNSNNNEIRTNADVCAGTQSPDGSAIMQADSTTKGFLPPRMTTTQRNAIATPAEGLLVFDTTLHQSWQYQNGAWAEVGGGSGSAAGSDTQIQFNSSGAFGASSGLLFDGADVNDPILIVVSSTSRTSSCREMQERLLVLRTQTVQLSMGI